MTLKKKIHSVGSPELDQLSQFVTNDIQISLN